MEKSGYHEHLTMLRERFPGEEVLPVSRVAQMLHRDYRSLLSDKSFPYKKSGRRYLVSVVSLARWMC